MYCNPGAFEHCQQSHNAFCVGYYSLSLWTWYHEKISTVFASMVFIMALADKRCKQASLITDHAGVRSFQFTIIKVMTGQWYSRCLALYSQAVDIYKLDHFHGNRLGVDWGNYNDYCMYPRWMGLRVSLFLWLQSLLKMQIIVISGLCDSVNKLCVAHSLHNVMFTGIYVQTLKWWSGCWVETPCTRA